MAVIYRKLRLVNVKVLLEHEGPFSLADFEWIVTKHIEQAKSILLNGYYNSVVDIFLLGSKKGKLPNPAFPKRIQKFFNSVATIMTYHMQTLCLKSLYEYVEYITDIRVTVI